MTKEPLWLQLLNQSLSGSILSKLTPKKKNQEVIQNAKCEFIHKSEMFGERFYIITAWICPAAWQWHCIHHSWRQCETRVNATRRKQKDTPKLDASRYTINLSLSSSKGYRFPSQASAFHKSSRAAASTLSSFLLSPCPMSSSRWKAIQDLEAEQQLLAAEKWPWETLPEAGTIASMSKSFHSSDQSKNLGFSALLTWRVNWAPPHLYSMWETEILS